VIQKPNLLPPDYLPPPPVNWPRMGIIAVCLTLFFALGIGSAKFYLDIQSREAEVQSLTNALANLSPTQERIQDVLKLQKEVERLRTLSGKSSQEELAWSAVLTDIARVMPSGLRFERVQAEKGTVTILGKASSSLDVAAYVIELRKFTWFSRVEIKTIDAVTTAIAGLAARQEYSFEITAQLPVKGGQDSAAKPVQQKPSP